jgi:F-type H+-transporting ATPase subunit b
MFQRKIVFQQTVKKNSEPALVRSTFDLPAAQRAAIQNALNETFSAEIHIRFETSPDLVSGIELSANGQKVGWTIADYLASLEKGVGELLKEKDKPEPKSEVKVEPKSEGPKPEVKPVSKPKAKLEATPVSKPEVKVQAKPEVELKSEAKAKTPSTLTPQTLKRVHDFYETLGREDVQAVQAWEKAERESREGEVKAKLESKPEVEAAPKPETTTEPKPEESKPAIKSQ